MKCTFNIGGIEYMAKGMSLEEFRDALSSDATIENDRLKIELSELKKSTSKKIKDLENEIEQYKEWHRQLCNRCFVQTRGIICISCGIECEHGYTYDDLEAASRYMRKNKLLRTPETYQKVNDFLRQRREKREKKSSGK